MYQNHEIPSHSSLQFKAEFKVVSTLQGLSGFGWDDVRKMVTAMDQVWDAYLKVRWLYCCSLESLANEFSGRGTNKLVHFVNAHFHCMMTLQH